MSLRGACKSLTVGCTSSILACWLPALFHSNCIILLLSRTARMWSPKYGICLLGISLINWFGFLCVALEASIHTLFVWGISPDTLHWSQTFPALLLRTLNCMYLTLGFVLWVLWAGAGTLGITGLTSMLACSPVQGPRVQMIKCDFCPHRQSSGKADVSTQLLKIC